MGCFSLGALNPQQASAVCYLDGPLLVIAGAGSGKTRVITHKIAYLISTGLPARSIVAVTFTNKAAREMKTRVQQLLAGTPHPGLRIATFHQLGLTILRQEIRYLSKYRASFSVLDTEDSAKLLGELLYSEVGNVPEPESYYQAQISIWKNNLLTPEQALQQAQTEQEQRSARLYQQYQNQLSAYNAFDFDDLIFQPVQLFLEQPAILARWQHKIRYLLMDEYQDTNTAQYQLIQLLLQHSGAFTAVGDDDQSIYAWRGARPENLQRLAQDFPALKIIALEQNYRSTRCILKAANHLITHNPHLFPKTLWSQLGPGEKIKVFLCPNGEQEVEKVISELLQHRFKYNTQWRDYAILYRSNHQSRGLEQALRAQRIPYHLSGGTSFFAHAEIKDIMAYLRLLVNPQDDAAFLRIVNTPRRKIGAATLEKLGQYAQFRGVSLFTAAQELGLAQHLSARALQPLQQFADQMMQLSRQLQQAADPLPVVHSLLQQLDYAAWLREISGSDKAAAQRLNHVMALLDWLKQLQETKRAAEQQVHPELGDLVAHLTLVDILERQTEDQRDNEVSLMTLHAAKGLEFPVVIMMGMEEELLPHRESLKEGAIEEERRLAYVGLTRAQKQLILTLAAKRQRHGETVDCEPSRFLKELPDDTVEWQGKTLDAVAAQAYGQAHLDALKALLQKK